MRKCRVDYFGSYLFYNGCEMNIDTYPAPTYGFLDYLVEQKRMIHIWALTGGQFRGFGQS